MKERNNNKEKERNGERRKNGMRKLRFSGDLFGQNFCKTLMMM
jgi:hypothetical protein